MWHWQVQCLIRAHTCLIQHAYSLLPHMAQEPKSVKSFIFIFNRAKFFLSSSRMMKLQIFWYVFFFYLFETWRDRGTGRQTQIAYLLVHYPNVHNWAQMEEGTWNSGQVSHVGSKYPIPLVITCYPHRVFLSRKLES